MKKKTTYVPGDIVVAREQVKTDTGSFVPIGTVGRIFEVRKFMAEPGFWYVVNFGTYGKAPVRPSKIRLHRLYRKKKSNPGRTYTCAFCDTKLKAVNSRVRCPECGALYAVVPRRRKYR